MNMRYASIFVTILLIWVAIILIAFTRKNPHDIFQLYLGAVGSTLILFLIGFARK
jgi:hypothetical protein